MNWGPFAQQFLDDWLFKEYAYASGQVLCNHHSKANLGHLFDEVLRCHFCGAAV